ncbi:MAG TPA: hypothetical protein VMI13_03335 [Solirubrobacteraceae bacterium]|nr:hypothetical protein [Solirubrobacteraceae bacterium]
MIAAHPPPAELQRCHWYANDVGLFDHEPLDPFSLSPSTGEPEITGKPVFTGTGGGGGVSEGG